MKLEMGLGARLLAKEMDKEELLKFLDDWTYLKRVTVIDLPDWWGNEKDEQAYQQIRKKIESKVSKEFVEKWVEIIRPETPTTIRIAIKEMLQEAGIEVGECSHSRIVCINEEGNAGVFCADCGEQLEKEC